MGGGFYDLNIVVDRKNGNHMKLLMDTLKTAYNFGYDTVAVNTILPADALQSKKGKPTQIPKPLAIPLHDVVTEKNSRKKFKILQRLTVIISDAAQTHKLQTSNEVKEYDILAVQPENDKSFHVCCSSLDIDIITFSIVSRLPVYLKHQQVGMALERGIFFEIVYTPSLWDAMVRRHTISNAINIISTCKRKNVIVSSQAEKPMDLRGPYDVINLCNLFGLKAAQARDVITSWGRGAVLKAECRKSGKGVFTIRATSDLPAEDQWKINNCRNSEEAILSSHQPQEVDEVPLPPKPKKMRKK